MELVLTCWTHMSAPNRIYVAALVHELYQSTCNCEECDIHRNRHLCAVNIIGVDTLVQKFEEWLMVCVRNESPSCV